MAKRKGRMSEEKRNVISSLIEIYLVLRTRQQQDLEISIAKEKVEKTPLTKEQIMFWLSKFKNGDVNNIVYQKEVIDIFVNFVYLDDDKIVIGFNYKDGTKTLLLSELEGEPSSEVLSSYLEQSTPPFTKPAIPMVCRLFTFFVIFKRQRNS